MPTECGNSEYDFAYMDAIRQVIQYSGLNYNEVLELPTDVFLLMRKNFIVEKLKQTEEGRKYLSDCERLGITEPDFEALHARFNKVGE